MEDGVGVKRGPVRSEKRVAAARNKWMWPPVVLTIENIGLMFHVKFIWTS